MDQGNNFSLSSFLAVAVEEGDVDAAAFIVVLKVDDVRFVEEIGIEDDRMALAVRDRDGFGLALFVELLNSVTGCLLGCGQLRLFRALQGKRR